MSERKVLNKYYPPDFDPNNIPKMRVKRTGVFNIRVMAPCNMRCNTCGEYIYKGKKFNSRKENVDNEYYLGLRIFRFYIKCPKCISEIAFKTDLKNTDYVVEAGATRLFEAEKIAQQMAEEERKAKEEEELNPMKLLENRTEASRNEIEQIDTLEELRELSARQAKVDTETMLRQQQEAVEREVQRQLEEEEREIKAIFGEVEGHKFKRLIEEESDDVGPTPNKRLAANVSTPSDILTEDSSKERKKSASEKKPASWERSVGGFSNKNSLKLLVRKKEPVKASKSDPTPATLSNTQSKSGDAESGNSITPNSSQGNTSQYHGEGKELNANGISCGKDKDNCQAVTSSLSQKGSTKDLKTSHMEDSNQRGPVMGGALAMLGGYSDSEESDNSS